MFKIERYLFSNDNLGNCVKFIWHFKGDNLEVHHKLLPMDCIDIVINLADDLIYETAIETIIAPKILC